MNWIVIKALHKIYEKGSVKKNATLLNDSKVKHLINQTIELSVVGDSIIKNQGFDEYYQKNHLSNFHKYSEFLSENGFLKRQTRFKEKEIETLIDISEGMSNGQLASVRKQIIDFEESIRGVSRMFFKNEKYLINKEALTKAVKQLLQIEKLADDKDQQYKYVLECDEPKCIVLCENIDFLKRPTRPREHNIELWYAGGKNINKLNYADISTRNLPIYYSCDWDYDGLKIYELVKEIIPEIELLYPNGSPDSIKSSEHKSLWRRQETLSGLSNNLYNPNQKQLIEELIQNDCWLMEESNDLIAMVERQNH
ncbi:MAG: hypothetical protein JJ978_13745 [Roseivirga sp.]|jgi:hypothetical protein|uniref:hypothetical protein n=1 Tax=Roseivirga sp. TaxID=1964215 RepID=UPI001B0B93A2|nr:hypothetical protein [Roseivirga sp.]MBO6496630.1 hypothetical protein [Roseivirga sp.]